MAKIYKIAVLARDGICPQVIKKEKKNIKKDKKKFKFNLE